MPSYTSCALGGAPQNAKQLPACGPQSDPEGPAYPPVAVNASVPPQGGPQPPPPSALLDPTTLKWIADVSGCCFSMWILSSLAFTEMVMVLQTLLHLCIVNLIDE